jgi:hypothetical protein
MTREMEELKGNKKGKTAKKSGFLNTIMGGGWLANKAFTRNAPLFALIVIYCFIYVSNRYEYERELMEIEKLTKRRDLLRNNLLTLKSEFTSKTRQTQMEKLLKQRNSELEPMTRPMYSIEK